VNASEEEESESEEESYQYGEYQCEQDENIDEYPSLKKQKSMRKHRHAVKGRRNRRERSNSLGKSPSKREPVQELG